MLYDAYRALSSFFLGSMSSAVAVALSYPFDLMRTQFVVQGGGLKQLFPSISSFVTHTYRAKGLPGFFAGLPAAVVGIVPSMGLNFAIYEVLLSSLKTFRENVQSSSSTSNDTNRTSIPGINRSIASTVLSSGGCGAVSGGVSKLLVYPLDTVKKLLQLEVVQCSFQQQGHIVTDSTAIGINTAGMSGSCGIKGLSGSPSTSPKYQSLGECISWVYRHEGLRGYYKGVVPSVWKSVLSTGVMFATYQSVKQFLDTIL